MFVLKFHCLNVSALLLTKFLLHRNARYRYQTYRKKMEEHYKEAEQQGRPPLTEAQKARKLIAGDAKALQEIRYYQ